MIIVTGGAGFIGSCIVKGLNDLGISNIIIVDELGTDEKWKNLVNLKYKDFIHKNNFLE
ncbi:MAG: NAD-dependent epimerase/dehydratase family protein, partial [Nanoarchaeota archaeon]|nr:NAD-dependent epimerase/dehydratase family protein [Nanoarchaeota archaeon]